MMRMMRMAMKMLVIHFVIGLIMMVTVWMVIAMMMLLM